MRRRKARFAFSLVELVVVLAILGTLLALVIPAVMKARASAARTACTVNLRQLGLALHNYHDTFEVLPAGHTGPDDKRYPLLGWQARILPFVEQTALWYATADAYAKDRRPFDDPPHVGFGTVVRIYGCPADSRTSETQTAQQGLYNPALTSYLGIAGTNYKSKDGVLYSDSRVRITDIKDGTSNTLMVGERPPSSGFYWGWWYAGRGQVNTGSGDMVLGTREMNVSDIWNGFEQCPAGPYHFVSGRIQNNCDILHFWSPHAGGANFLFADGSVHFLSYSADSILAALGTRSGGEAVSMQ